MTTRQRTASDIKNLFAEAGIPIAAWAREYGFSGMAVTRVLNGGATCARRGQPHKIAVLFGLKPGFIIEDNEHLRQRYIEILGPDRVLYSRDALSKGTFSRAATAPAEG